RVRPVNLYTDEVGNPEVPEKLKSGSAAAAIRQSGSDSAAKKSPSRRKYILTTGAAILLLIAGFLFWQRGKSKTPTTAIPQKSIAVLPFENRSEDKANAYFTDGIQDEILTRLSKIADLKVISRTSTQHYKSAPENLPEI